MTAVAGANILVTGGSRGIGRAVVEELYKRGAKTVYATARDPRTITHPDAVPLALEVTDPASVAAAAEAAGDVTVLVNNAGTAAALPFLSGELPALRAEFETNYYGPLLMARAFTPIIERNGGGHILNVLSLVSWVSALGSYSATKAALWSQTNGLRVELAPRGITVSGLHVGFVDTELAAGFDAPKTSPDAVARAAVDGIEADAWEILVDERTRQVKAALSGDLAALYPQLQH